MPENRVIVVTGAAGGMGQSVCKHFVSSGDRVIGIDCEVERLKKLSIELGDTFVPFEFDLSKSNFSSLELLLKDYPTVKGLINLAGVSLGDRLDKLEEEDWDQSFRVNSTAVMKLSKIIAPQLSANGGGVILNISSPVGLIGARKPSYAASKAALTGLTMSMARNLGPDNIRVNMVLPGTSITYMTNDWSEEKQASIAEGTHLGRLCEPEELAKLLYFLCSDENSYMSGSIVDLSCGGMFGH